MFRYVQKKKEKKSQTYFSPRRKKDATTMHTFYWIWKMICDRKWSSTQRRAINPLAPVKSSSILLCRTKGSNQTTWRKTFLSCPRRLTPAAWNWPLERSGSVLLLPPMCGPPHRPSPGRALWCLYDYTLYRKAVLKSHQLFSLRQPLFIIVCLKHDKLISHFFSFKLTCEFPHYLAYCAWHLH